MKFDYYQSIKGIVKKTFKFKGVSNRPDFICGIATYISIYIIYCYLQKSFFRAHIAGNTSVVLPFIMLFIDAIMVFMLISLLSLTTRRLRDAGFSGSLAILAYLFSLVMDAVFFIGVAAHGLSVSPLYSIALLAGIVPFLVILALCLFVGTKTNKQLNSDMSTNKQTLEL